MNIFSVPSYRRKKPKRKHLKFQNLAEDDDYENFRKFAETRIQAQIEDINKNILSRVDPELKIEYDPEYEFSDDKEDWVAALSIDSQYDAKIFPVGVNIPAIYEFLYDHGMENDNLEADLQLRSSLLHETAHAIVRYLGDTEMFDMELSPYEEENVCEEFSKYHLREYTGQATSRLQDTLNSLFGVG